MDKIGKALKKLSQKERQIVQQILVSLKSRNFQDLDIKKLKGYQDIFRIRKGQIRIIYRLNRENNFIILAIERRSDVTYKNL